MIYWHRSSNELNINVSEGKLSSFDAWRKADWHVGAASSDRILIKESAHLLGLGMINIKDSNGRKTLLSLNPHLYLETFDFGNRQKNIPGRLRTNNVPYARFLSFLME